GLPRLMRNPEDKSAGYTAVTVIAAIVIGIVISIVGGLIAAPAMMASSAMGALGTAMSGGKGVEPVQLDQLKPFLPENFAGLARTNTRSERSGVQGLMS